MVGPHGRTTWWNHSGIGHWRPPATRLSRIVTACLLLITPAGCMGVNARDARTAECDRGRLGAHWKQIAA